MSPRIEAPEHWHAAMARVSDIWKAHGVDGDERMWDTDGIGCTLRLPAGFVPEAQADSLPAYFLSEATERHGLGVVVETGTKQRKRVVDVGTSWIDERYAKLVTEIFGDVVWCCRPDEPLSAVVARKGDDAVAIVMPVRR